MTPDQAHDDSDALTIGRRIRQLRTAQRMTLEELAGRIDRAPSQVSMFETGKREPKLTLLQTIAKVLGTSLDGLLEGEPLDERATKEIALERAGYSRPFEHTASTIHLSELLTWDLVLPMTAEHAAVLRRMTDQAPPGSRVPEVVLWRQFDPTAPVQAGCRADGVVVRASGTSIVLSPPLVITRDELDVLVATFGEVLRDLGTH